MNTRDMLERAADLLEDFDLLFLNGEYTTHQEKDLIDRLDKFRDDFHDMRGV